MLRHQIPLIPTTPDDVISPTSENSRGFSWWAVPSPKGWLLVNENFGYVALVPEGEEKLVNRVGRTAIETINRLAPGDKKHLAVSISDHIEDIRWRSGDDMPDYVDERIARVMQLAEKSKDQFSFEKAVERMNKTESVTLKGRTFMPEDGFIGLLTEIQDDFEDYLVTEGFWTRLGNFIRGKKPWLGD